MKDNLLFSKAEDVQSPAAVHEHEVEEKLEATEKVDPEERAEDPAEAHKRLCGLLEDLLSSSHPKTESFVQVEGIFRGLHKTTPQIVDTFLKQLSVILKSPNTVLLQNEKLKNLAESVLFLENRKFLKEVLLRSMLVISGQLAECVTTAEAEQIVLFMLDTSLKLRNIPKFIMYVLRAVQDCRGNVSLKEETFLEKLAECVLKMPINQNLTVLKNISDIQRQEYSKLSENPSGKT